MEVSTLLPTNQVRHRSHLWIVEDGRAFVLATRDGKTTVSELGRNATQVFASCNKKTVREIVKEEQDHHKRANPAKVASETEKFLARMEKLGALYIGSGNMNETGRSLEPGEWPSISTKNITGQRGRRVLLVNPPQPLADRVSVPVPLNLLLLGQTLIKGSFEVAILDMYTKDLRPVEIRGVLEHFQPQVVGITMITAAAPSAYRLIELIRETDPQIKVVVGGPHPTALPEEAIERGTDVVVRFEGIRTLVELAHCFSARRSLGEARGVVFRRRGRMVHTSPQELVPGGDLPDPAYELVRLEDYTDPGALLFAQGCRGNCKFCSIPHPCGRRIRVRNVERLIADISYLVKRGVTDFQFYDDSMLAAPDLARRLFTAIKELKTRLTFSCQARADEVARNPELIALVAEAGMIRVEIGVEAGNYDVRKWAGKAIHDETIFEAVKLLQSHEIEVSCGFILALPPDTQETMEETTSLACKLIREGVSATPTGVFSPFPGMPIYDHLEELGVRIIDLDYERRNFHDVVIETKHLTAEEIRRHYLHHLIRTDKALAHGQERR